MKSIMQKKDGTCYLCNMLNGDDGKKLVQEHHVIYGTSGRKLAEKYGLKVYLCMAHHTAGKEAVHQNAENSLLLKIQAQRLFQSHYSELDWMSVFGRNYEEA